MRRPLVQTATGQDDDAGSDRTSERTTILRIHGLGDDDKTLDAAASCKEPSSIDQNLCAHWRSPMDLMRQGWLTSLFQA
jgi:hypothetical protein